MTAPANWENMPSCELCGATFGLSHRRHHCRTCNKCVCSGCSPSTIKLDSVSGLQRACTPCVSVAARAPAVSNSLLDIGERLHSMCGVKLNAKKNFDGLDDILEFCKAALNPLQDVLIQSQNKYVTAEQRIRELEAKLRWAQDTSAALGEQLFTIAGGARTCLAVPAPTAGLVKILGFCNDLLPAFQEEHKRQAAVAEKLRRTEICLADEEQERARLESLLIEARKFCKTVDQRFKSLGTEITLQSRKDAALHSGTIVSVAQPNREPELENKLGSTIDASTIYCETAVKSWEEDTSNCAICGEKFSVMKNRKRRHHCRICGRCVCSTCSPSSVQLKGFSTLERACTPCISNAQRAPEMRVTAVQMAIRLNLLCGLSAPNSCQLESLAEALAFCESAVAPLEAMLGGGSTKDEDTEAEPMKFQVVEARAEAQRVRRELEGITSQLSLVHDWSQWVDNEASGLLSRLEGVNGSDEQHSCVVNDSGNANLPRTLSRESDRSSVVTSISDSLPERHGIVADDAIHADLEKTLSRDINRTSVVTNMTDSLPERHGSVTDDTINTNLEKALSRESNRSSVVSSMTERVAVTSLERDELRSGPVVSSELPTTSESPFIDAPAVAECPGGHDEPCYSTLARVDASCSRSECPPDDTVGGNPFSLEDTRDESFQHRDSANPFEDELGGKSEEDGNSGSEDSCREDGNPFQK